MIIVSNKLRLIHNCAPMHGRYILVIPPKMNAFLGYQEWHNVIVSILCNLRYPYWFFSTVVETFCKLLNLRVPTVHLGARGLITYYYHSKLLLNIRLWESWILEGLEKRWLTRDRTNMAHLPITHLRLETADIYLVHNHSQWITVTIDALLCGKR